MENIEAVNEQGKQGQIVIEFSGDAAQEVYKIVIDTVEKAFRTVIALGSPDMMREAELRLQEYAAQLHNAQSPFKGKVMERDTMPEVRP